MGYTSDKQQKFCDMFSDIPLDANLVEIFKNAVVSRIIYIKSTGQVQINLDLPCLVRIQHIRSLENALSGFFSTSVSIIPCFRVETDDSEFADFCREYLYQVVESKSKHYGVLIRDSEIELKGNRIEIYLKTPCRAILQSGKCDKYLEDYFKNCFNRNVTVEIIDPPVDDALNSEYLKQKMEL